MLILMTGGGSLGSISPLLSIQQDLKTNFKNNKLDFFWLISKHGPENKTLAEKNIKYKKIFSARLKRGLNLTIFWQFLKLIIAFWQGLFFLVHHRPNLIISAGSYVSPPVIWAGWILGIPSVIYQQDLRPGLANKMMAPFAKHIATYFPETAQYFNQQKTSIVSHPVRGEIVLAGQLSAGEKKENIAKAKKYFQLEDDLPTILVVSGSQGANIINQTLIDSLPRLLEICQIIHVTGKREIKNESKINNKIKNRYHNFEFLTDHYLDALFVSDLIISRAGINFITELAYIKKPALLIPVRDSHQEDNALYFQKLNAVEVLLEKNINQLSHKIQTLLNDKKQLDKLADNISKNTITQSTKGSIVQQIVNFLK